MPLTKRDRNAIVTTIIGLLLSAFFLVSLFGWFFAGHVIFGLTVGLMVGMSKSAVVSAALPLLFTFAGTSIIALSIGENRTVDQLALLGRQLVGFGMGTSSGVLVGILLKKIEIELPLGKLKDKDN